jgi:hypothetical protein
MARVKYILLVPLTYNDKTKVPKKVRDGILDELYALAGGYHIGGAGKGAYRMRNGQKKVEHSLEVWVAVEEEDVVELEAIVAKFAAVLGQETMYLERTGSAVRFVPPTPVGGLAT